MNLRSADEMRRFQPNGIESAQLQCFGAVVHYFDKDGALHSGRLLRKIKRGKKRGAFVVADGFGKALIPAKVRNIEYPVKTPDPA
jgi:hypothetical protein